jgi:hypothetical protein
MSFFQRYKFWRETGEFGRIDSIFNALAIKDQFLYKFNLLTRKHCKEVSK